MKRISILAITSLFASAAFAVSYSVKSPDGSIEAVVNTDKKITFSVLADGKEMLKDVEIAMNTDKGVFDGSVKLATVKNSSKDDVIKPVYGLNSTIKDRYNQLELDFKTFKVLFRAYDEAVAYRFVSNMGKGEMKVLSEKLNLNVKADCPMIAPIADANMSDYETYFSRITPKALEVKNVGNAKTQQTGALVKSVDDGKCALTPIIVQGNGAKIAVVESDVDSYPMLRFTYDASCGLKGKFVNYPKNLKVLNNFMMQYGEFENFIAKTSTTRAFPWRAFIVARRDADLAVNDTVYKLAEPSRLKDTSWIKPGGCVWEWWNNWGLEGVDFETGVNEQTYYKYIDFAAEHSITYVLFDAGWLVGEDVGKMGKDVHDRAIDGKPFLNVKKLIDYAHSKNVKILLWCLGESMNRYAEKAIPLMKSWGADGLKVDFFNRDDQTAMELYYRIARVAAENKMVIDFHGCAKPAGLQRTYPNVVNFEGVRGLEYNKFSPKGRNVTPTHDVDLVMTRMLQGPMDYTPGAVTNVKPVHFVKNNDCPVSEGTRSHQAALYVLFYAPLQMLCDSPTQYAKYPTYTSFIASVPTNWDESKAIDAKIGEYVVLARRKGDTWYIAGICDAKGKDVEIDLSKIVPEGSYTAEIFADTINSNKTPMDYNVSSKIVESTDKMKMSMKIGGGFVIKLTPASVFQKLLRSVF